MRTEARTWLLLAFSLLLALVLELLPFPQSFVQIEPPWLMLLVLYWGIMQPAALGMTGAWLLGLVLDGVHASPLGTHTALFTLAITPVLALQRLLRALPVIQQALWIAGIVFLYELGELWLSDHPSTGQVSAEDFLPVISTLIAWPMLRLLLYRCERCLG